MAFWLYGFTTGKRRSKRRSSRGLAVGLNGSSVLEECRFIPLRLDERERGLLAMLKGALNVSEYTDRVDCFSRWESTAKTIKAQLRYALAALSGMVVAGELRQRVCLPKQSVVSCPGAIPVWLGVQINFPQLL